MAASGKQTFVLGIDRGDGHDRCYVLFDVQGCSSAAGLLKPGYSGLDAEVFVSTGSCDSCHQRSNGWFTRLRIHALRPDSVDAGDDSQTQGDRIFGADGAEAEGFLVESSRAGGADAACGKFSFVPSGCDLAPVSRSARNLFTRLNLQFTIDKRPDL